MLKKPRRSLSGIVVIAVMSPSFKCPGNCIYCFKGDNAAQSYTGLEPAARRAIRLHYNPYLITKARLEQLERNGHATDKLEVIVMGGTFNFYPKRFQEKFVKRIFDAANGIEAKDIKEAHKINEGAEHRIVGLTFETRPDYASIEELKWFLSLGATRIELGVQSVYDDVLEAVRRGHRLKESIEATRNAKDLGYKVVHHIMPGLPGSNPIRDIEMFDILFKNEDLRPDMLKIYPTIVVPNSELENWWKKGLFKPINDNYAHKLVAALLTFLPPYVRVMRINRDVPSNAIVDGVKKTNLRQRAHEVLNKLNIKIDEIRYREVLNEENLNPKLIERRYKASKATEVFLSWEDEEKDKIIGFLRLRLLNRFIHPVLENSAIVREIRIYGPEARIGEKGLWQHKGLGKKLMQRAEEIAKEEGYSKLAVISGVGVRGYFRKLGYVFEDPYMVKYL